MLDRELNCGWVINGEGVINWWARLELVDWGWGCDVYLCGGWTVRYIPKV